MGEKYVLKSAICSYLDSFYLGFATQCDFLKKKSQFSAAHNKPLPKKHTDTHTHLKRPKMFFHYALLRSITISFPRKIHIISLPNSITFSCSIPFFPRLWVKHRSLKMEDRGCEVFKFDPETVDISTIYQSYTLY